MNPKTQPVEEAMDPPPNPQAPQGWRPGVKFYSPHGRYTLQVSSTIITTVNGVTTRVPAKLVEFHDGEYTPRNRDEYQALFTKWYELYGHIPFDPEAPSVKPYHFWEAAEGELNPAPKRLLVSMGPKTTADTKAGAKDVS